MRYISRKSVVLILLCAVALLCVGLSVANFTRANALTLSPVSPEFNLPSSAMEYQELNSPQDVYCDDTVCAIIQNNNELLISENGGKFIKSSATFTSLQQVKRLDENYLLVSDEAKLYKIDLNDDAYPKEIVNYNADPVTFNLFDYHDGFLVGNYSAAISLYTIENGVVKSKSTIGASGDYLNSSPVCIKNGFIYFTNVNSKLAMRSTDVTQSPIVLADITPSKMITDGEFVYCLCTDGIYRVDVASKSAEKLNFPQDADFNLGNVQSATGISFKGDNLLISDSSINAVQEFAIDGNNLIFTGFAISSGNTVYNRLKANSKDVELYGGRIAVLGDTDLMIYTESDTPYTRENYTWLKFGAQNFVGYAPNLFALGKDTVILSHSTNKVAHVYDINDGTLSSAITFDGEMPILDVCYQGGFYYLLKLNYNSGYEAVVYKISEDASAPTKQIVLTAPSDYDEKSLLTVDVNGNIYLSTKDGFMTVFKKADDYDATKKQVLSTTATTGVKKLCADLGGNLYALGDNAINCYTNGDIIDIPVSLSANGSALDVKSFAINFDDKTSYFISANSEILFSTENLPKLSIDDIAVPTEFVLSGDNADVSDLKLYNIKDGVNAYAIVKGEEKFDYEGLLNTENLSNDFVYVCSLSLSPAQNFGTTEFLVLAGLNENATTFVIINANDGVVSDNVPVDASISKAYIATDVNAYFLPVLTINNDFVLANDDGAIRLSQGAVITPIKEFNFLGRDFYYALITDANNPVYGYVPASFTVEMLNEDYQNVPYTIEKVSSTDVFSDSALTNKIATLEDDTEIKLFEENDGACSIAFKTESGWVKGYISSDSVKPQTSNALRNTLIIIAVALAVCGTSIFIVLRRKG